MLTLNRNKTLAYIVASSMLLFSMPSLAQQVVTTLRPSQTLSQQGGDSLEGVGQTGNVTGSNNESNQGDVPVFPEPLNTLDTGGFDDQGNSLNEPLVVDGVAVDGDAETDNVDAATEQNRRARRAEQVGTIGADGEITPLANTRAVAEQGVPTTREDDPFAPIGIRVGSFLLFPTLNQSIGTVTNADAVADGEGSLFSQTDVRVRAQSNWALNELRGEIGANHQEFFNDTTDAITTIDGNLALRIDHSGGLVTRFGGGFNIGEESPVSDNVAVNDNATTRRINGFAEVEKQTGRLNVLLRGSFETAQFDDARALDGTVLSQEDRNSILYQLTGRLGYQTSQAIQPFVEASVGLRSFDELTDRNGDNRNSTLYSLRGGVAFDMGEKLNGELALGYSAESFDDSNLAILDGFTLDGTVNWSPQQYTTVTGTVQTAFTGSTNAGESGSTTQAVSLAIARDVRVNLSLNAQVLASLQSFDNGREDTTLQAQVGGEWRLNRSMAAFANAGYETVDSTLDSATYDAATARIGLRLQR